MVNFISKAKMLLRMIARQWKEWKHTHTQVLILKNDIL